MDLLNWLAGLTPAVWMHESLFMYPIVLTCHALGMGLLVGAVYAYSVRVLGFAQAIPLAWFERLYVLAWGGFILNAISGAFLFINEPVKLFFSDTFRIKMLLIVCGGLSVWLLDRQLGQKKQAPAPQGVKMLAAACIVLWTSVIVTGRLTAYLIEGPK